MVVTEPIDQNDLGPSITVGQCLIVVSDIGYHNFVLEAEFHKPAEWLNRFPKFDSLCQLFDRWREVTSFVANRCP